MQYLIEFFNEITNYSFFTFGGVSFSIVVFFQLFLSLFWVWITIKVVQILLKRVILTRLGMDIGSRESFTSLTSYGIGILGFLGSLQAVGVNLSSFFVIAGGLGIGLGFGLQNITRDLISGIIILLRSSIKVNDFLEMGGGHEYDHVQGTVKSIALLATILETKDGGSLILPNSYLVSSSILNWSYNKKPSRIKTTLRVRCDSDLVLFTETVLSTVSLEKLIANHPEPKLLFEELGETYLIFVLEAWIKDIRDEDLVRSNLNYALEYYLRQKEIYVSFPDQDVFIHHPVVNDKKPVLAFSVRDLLKTVTYFEKFSELELRRLIEIGYRKRLDPQEILFKEGDSGDAFYIILEGKVEIFVAKIDKTLTTLKAGDFFGELALILGIPRTASVKGVEPTLLFAINRKGFEKLLQDQEELAEVIIQELSRHQEELAERQKQLREMGLISADEDDHNLVSWVRKRFNNLFSIEV